MENKNETAYREELKLLTTYPKDFSPTDPERIRIFGERLLSLRLNAEKRNQTIIRNDDGSARFGPGYCDVKTQGDLARKLHVSTQCISYYEKGRNKSIPMDKLIDICGIFDSTPHYLLGYSSLPNHIITFDKNGNIEYGPDGKPREIYAQMYYPENSQRKASLRLADIEKKNPQYFCILCELLNSTEKMQEVCFSVLSTLLKSRIDG